MPFSWFRGRRKQQSLRARKARPQGVRPTLEVLEDRLAPAVFPVSTTLDDGSPGSLRFALAQASAASLT